MQIAYVGVFQHLPANSGNDWYSLQLVDDLQTIGGVTLYYTLHENGKRGYTPANRIIKQKYLAPSVKWHRISPRLDQLRPEMLFDGSAVKDIKADLVFARLYSYHIARHVAKNNDAPIVIVMQNIEWEYLKNIGYLPLIYAPARLYENFVLRKAAAVIVLSPRDYVYAIAVTSAEKVFYVPYQPNEGLFGADATSCYNYAADKLNVLFYGSLDRYHNVKALEFIKRELIPEIKERGLFHSIQVHVLGSGEPPEHLDLDNDPDINFFGWVENPAPYIRGADVVIVPVRNASGVKVRVLEALSCKKLIIAFPEAIAGLGNKPSAAVILANTAEEFVESLKSLPRDAHCMSVAHPAARANVATASDAACYVLEKKGYTLPKNTRSSQGAAQ